MFDENVNEELQTSDDNKDHSNEPYAKEGDGTIGQEAKLQESSANGNEESSVKTVQNTDKVESPDSKKIVHKPSGSSHLGLGVALGLIAGIFLTAIVFTVFFGNRFFTSSKTDYSEQTSQTYKKSKTKKSKSKATKESEAESENTASEGELPLDDINNKLQSLQRIIDKSYLFEEKMEDVENGIYKGFMSGLGDPYTVYYTEKEYKDLMQETSGTYYGIGAMINKNVNTGIITIIKVFPGSPAEEAGLMSGDIIYKVGDTEVNGMDLEILVGTYIKGAEGSTVDITVIRGEDAQELTFSVTRRSIEVPTVESKVLEDNIGYIKVNQFDDVTFPQFKASVEDFKQKSISKLVIDLRDNPGGLLSATIDMLDYILPKGIVVYTQDKNGKREDFYSEEKSKLNMDIVVLINGESASASEVFSGAIKDFKYGTLIGTKSFGKGIVQSVVPLKDGSAVKITTQHYYTPSGFDLHGKGIEPDEVVELDKDAVKGEASDNQLNRAIEILKSK